MILQKKLFLSKHLNTYTKWKNYIIYIQKNGFCALKKPLTFYVSSQLEKNFQKQCVHGFKNSVLVTKKHNQQLSVSTKHNIISTLSTIKHKRLYSLQLSAENKGCLQNTGNTVFSEVSFAQKLFIKNLTATIPKWIVHCILNKNEITVYIFPEFITPFFYFMKNHVNTQFRMLVDITAVDYPSRICRFEVVYNLLSVYYNSRIKIKTCLQEVSFCTSITVLYSSASWWEREVWDMFGIFFSNHPDLRRILTDYGFSGHPLRKDFPLSGFVEVRYDDSEKRVIIEPIEMTQEFRYFDFASPWQQIEKN